MWTVSLDGISFSKGYDDNENILEFLVPDEEVNVALFDIQVSSN